MPCCLSLCVEEKGVYRCIRPYATPAPLELSAQSASDRTGRPASVTFENRTPLIITGLASHVAPAGLSAAILEQAATAHFASNLMSERRWNLSRQRMRHQTITPWRRR